MKIIPPQRGYDKQGAGHFGAPRGSRTHNGIDLSCAKDSLVLSVCGGVVTKLGYPYNPSDEKKGHLRYVQVTDSKGNDLRYFYIKPLVSVGDKIAVDDVLGSVQGLASIYEGITEHYHFEIKKDGVYLNPNDFLTDLTEE